jgi:methylated-DNA-[protein]-cysteine S-methyltransferase
MSYGIIIPSPIQAITLLSDGEYLTGLYMAEESGEPYLPHDFEDGRNIGALAETEKQLYQYFDGSRITFDLPLRPAGTQFQLTVWKALQDIPYGTTITYGQLASRIGNPNASRAVGLANGSNPISIVVPCHRVIGANGKLVGYGGGLSRKEWLLNHEFEVRGLQG